MLVIFCFATPYIYLWTIHYLQRCIFWLMLFLWYFTQANSEEPVAYLFDGDMKLPSLDHNHTHFLLVNEGPGTATRREDSFRSRFEIYLCKGKWVNDNTCVCVCVCARARACVCVRARARASVCALLRECVCETNRVVTVPIPAVLGCSTIITEGQINRFRVSSTLLFFQSRLKTKHKSEDIPWDG